MNSTPAVGSTTDVRINSSLSPKIRHELFGLFYPIRCSLIVPFHQLPETFLDNYVAIVSTFREEKTVSAEEVPAEPERLSLCSVVDKGEGTLDAGQELRHIGGGGEAVVHRHGVTILFVFCVQLNFF